MSKRNSQKQAIEEAKRQAYLDALARRDLAWGYARIKFEDPDGQHKFVQKVESGEQEINREMVLQAVEEDIAKRTIHAHCHDHYKQFLNLAYRNVNTYMGYAEKGEPLHCEGCGEPLLCNGVDQRHDYRSVSFEECQRRNIYHGGNCYHVSECVRCGYINSIDTSG